MIDTNLPTTAVKPYANGHRPNMVQTPVQRPPQPPTAPPGKPSRIEKLQHDLLQARGEIQSLRSKLSSRGRGSSIVYRAVFDAQQIVIAAATDGQTGRDAMAKQGISQRRHRWAVAFLRYAKIAARTYSGAPQIDWLVRDTERVFILLERAALGLFDMPGSEALTILRAELQQK